MVALGGAVGALGRFGIAKAMPTSEGLIFPFATLTANLLGCFAIGCAFELLSKKPEWMFYLIAVGFLGGFTTFSSFGLETFNFLRSDKWMTAVIYVSASTIGGLICVYGGYQLVKWFN